MIRRVPTFLLLAILALPAAALSPQPARAQDTGGEAGVSAQVLARVNAHRREAGLGPVRLDAALSRAAQAHADAMATKDFFAHKSPDGTGFSGRAAQAGYHWRMIAENLAAGLDTPEATVDGWMASAGHRRNMLTGRFVDAGVGHAVLHPDPGEVRYGHYWVLLLGAPQDTAAAP